MKKLKILIISLVVSNSISAQIIDNLSIELNIGRYAKTIGLFDSGYYPNEFTYLNGFNISYSQTQKMSYFIGFRRINSTVNSGGGFTLETSVINGMEFRFGARISPKRDRRLFLNYGLEAFGEFSTQKGTYWVDYPPTYEINHRKSYLGIAPSLELNLRIVDRIIFFVETRYRLGMVNLIPIESTQSNKELYPNQKYWLNLFEPLNSVGLRVEL
jgi:hypothetical protein